jgi:hypothetical protein
MSIKSAITITFLFAVLGLKAQEKKKKSKELFDANLVVESDNSFVFKDKEFQKTELILKPEFSYKLTNISKFVLKGQLYKEFNDNLESGKPQQETVSKFNKRYFIGDKTNLELREFYLYTKIFKKVRLTLGKQQIVWGETDGLKLLDVINPQNYREFVLDNFEDSRIPLWSIKSEFNIKECSVQLVWIPDNTYHITQDLDAPFFTKSLFQSPPEGVSTKFNPTNNQTNLITDSDAGIRVSTFKKGWDITFNYLYYYEDLPVFYSEVLLVENQSPVLSIDTKFERQHLLGMTLNKVVGSSTLRGEIAYVFDQHFSSTNPESIHNVEESDQYKSALGIDYIKGEYVVSVQIFSDIIISDIDAYNRAQFETNTSLLVSKEMMNDNLKVEALWVHNINHKDGFVRPKVSYWLTTKTQLFLSSDLFYGEKSQLYGQFKDQSRVSVGFKWGI